MRKKKHRYSVYVVELSAKVWNHRRFRKSNPDFKIPEEMLKRVER